MNPNIYAVVVTYNRLALLKRAIASLQQQTLPLSGIVVVNNGSTDGTHEWLDQQQGLTVVHQDDVGGSGGFYTGMKTAYDLGADWLWCMDDDVWPTPECLETLYSYLPQHPEIGIICPRRLQAGKVVNIETVSFNLTNPFARLSAEISEELVGDNELFRIEGMVFEGPLISRKVVEKIGLPKKEMFIIVDDTEYSYRAVVNGFEVMYCKNAILNKELFPDQVGVWNVYLNNWKAFYFVRNQAYFCRLYGKTFWCRYLGGIRKYVSFIVFMDAENKRARIKRAYKLLLAFIAGKRKKLGTIDFS